ncbi:MAG: FAD:protein FMN transferase [Thermoguttaceae bacterium]|nr:FAD:protein FMN transferase [Thermoguttaceae bacterium]
MNARLFSLIFLFSFVFLTNTKAEERFEFEGIEMAVPIRIVLYAEDAQTAKKAADAALARFHDLNQRLSDYDEKSEIRRFCDDAGPGEFVRVSDDLWNCVRLAIHHAEISGGAFDPTVGQVVRLWRTARKVHRLPAENRIREALATVGWENILFDEERQAIAISAHGAKRHVRLDLGGIAKGYAIDEALKTMRFFGVTRVLLDAGGDLGLGDPPPGKAGWTIAVTPLKKGEKPTDFWTLKNCGVANSGDMYQFVEIDGKRYSHIVDPKTGLGLTNRLTVSVIAPTAADADALASALSVLGPKKGLALIQTLPHTEAQILHLTEDGKVEKFGKE